MNFSTTIRFRARIVAAMLCFAGLTGVWLFTSPVIAQSAGQGGQKSAKAEEKVVILQKDVPLYDVYAWERWGNFINAEAGSTTEIPYDAARLQVKVYTFPTGEIRAIRFNNAVRTHRHINQTDTLLYSWQAHRVQYVNNMAVVAGPGDFALHQKGVDHSGEEIRRGGGIDLEFVVTNPGRHNDPTGFWSFARDNPVQPAASWQQDGRTVEALGDAVRNAPAGAARYRVRIANLPLFQAREVYLDAGTIVASRDDASDRLLFVLEGQLTVTTGGRDYVLGPQDTARAISGQNFRVAAVTASRFVQASVPPAGKQ